MNIETPHNQTMLMGTRWGLMLGLQCDPFQTAALALYGEWSATEVDTICSCLKPGDVALDIGANIGTITVALAKRVGPRGAVYAFEPQRFAHNILCANVALTHCLIQTSIYNVAVGETDGQIKVPIPDITKGVNIGGMRLRDPRYSIPKLGDENVPLIRIDTLGLQRVDLMKIDVETMEGSVLAGALETIKRCKPIIFAETICDGFVDEVNNINLMMEVLFSNGYEVRQFAPPLYDENNLRFCPDNVFPGIDSNIIAWPDNRPKPEWFTALKPVTKATNETETAQA